MSESSESQARGWIMAAFVVIQTVFAGIALFYISYFRDEQKRKNEREMHEKERKEEREMQRLESDRKNIAAVLSKNYDEVQTIHNDLKSELENLNEIVIIDKDGDKITKFDVLVYMCHPDNRKRVQQTADARMAGERVACSQIEFSSPFKSRPPNSVREQAIERGLSSVLSDVDKIMKFFYKLRLTLSTSLDKKCPDDLNEEFGKEITAMLETIHPFVTPTSTRLKVINLVREYFKQPGSAQESQASPTPVVQNRQSRGLNDVAIPLVQENQPDPDPPGQNGTASGNQPGSDRIRDAIPYIESLRYENGKILCDIKCEFSSLTSLVRIYQPAITGRENEILEKIKELFGENQLNSNNLRHEIRKIMFDLSHSPNSELKSACEELNKYINGILNTSKNLNLKVEEMRSERALGDLQKMCKDHKWLLSEPDIREKLEKLCQDLDTFIKKKVAQSRSNNSEVQI